MRGGPPQCLLWAFLVLLQGRTEPGPSCLESCQGRPCGESPLDPGPCQQEEETTLPSSGSRDNWRTVLVFIIIASIVLISVGIFFFYAQIRTCLRSCLQQQQQVLEIQQIQQDQLDPSVFSVVNYHVFDGATEITDPWTPGAKDPQGPSDFSPALEGAHIIQCHHCASGGASGDEVVISPPELPPDTDLPDLAPAL